MDPLLRHITRNNVWKTLKWLHIFSRYSGYQNRVLNTTGEGAKRT